MARSIRAIRKTSTQKEMVEFISSSSVKETEVSADEKHEENGHQTNNVVKKPIVSTGISSHSSSRLFQPYRTVGIVTSGQGFQVQSAGTETFLVVPIGDRFQVLRYDKLSPSLVSAIAPAPLSSSKKKNNKIFHRSMLTKEKRQISHVVSDMSIGIAIASYSNCVALFKRMIHPVAAMEMSPNFPVQHMIYMGRGKQDVLANESAAQEGIDYDNDEIMMEVDVKKRAAILVAVICSPSPTTKHTNDGSNGVDDTPIVGDDDDDETASCDDSDISDMIECNRNDGGTTSDEEINSSDDDSSPNSVSSNSSTFKYGEIVLLRVRERVEVVRRIPLPFVATCAAHPDTYLNKLLVGGPSGQLALINVNTGKLVHLFQCILPHVLKSNLGVVAVSEDEEEDDDDFCARSDITVLTQSPAVDTIAVGTAGGKVHLINLKVDTILFTLEHDLWNKIKRTRKHVLFPEANKSAANMIGITSLTFRTDGYASAAHIAPLAVGRTDGSISIWDLNTTEQNPHRRLLHEIGHFHKGGVAKCAFLSLEPILITSGLQDNCIAMHVFDAPDNSSRVLRHRVGHASPPSFIRYLHPAIGGVTGDSKADGSDAANCSILSGGSVDRTLRMFSTARTVLDREWSQGQGLDKRARQSGIAKHDLLLPPIAMFATSEARSRDWGDTVTIHQNHANAYVWSSRQGAQSGPVLRQDDWNISAMKKQPPVECQAASVTMSACGHFCLVGTKGGMIYKYNVQSGMPRGTYPKQGITEKTTKNLNLPGSLSRTMRIMESNMKLSAPSNLDKKEADEEGQRVAERARKSRSTIARHSTSVVGLAVDSLNRTVISVGSDGNLLIWAFTTHAPHKKSPIILSSAGASKLCHVPESDLAAIALNDFSIVVLDCAALSIVRRLGNASSGRGVTSHSGPISDMGFGPDGRRLFTSSFDGTIRIWDVPTGSCIDWLSFQSPPTSLTISPTGEFLVTSHCDSVGLSVWCDKSFFHQVFLSGTPPLKPANMELPCPTAEESTDVDEERRAMENARISIQKDDGLLSVTESNGEEANTGSSKIRPKADGLITLSGLPPGHWKNLFHLELIKERNRPKEPPKKPPSAPFFLQWRQGEKAGNFEDAESSKRNLDDDKDEDVWNAAWSDDDDDAENKSNERVGQNNPIESAEPLEHSTRKRKKSYLRSRLADILQSCNESKSSFEPATDFFSQLGPSAIDVELTELCYGEQDQEGMQLLLLASKWLLEACQSKKSFEAINAYLNRFLHLHSNTIAGIEISLSVSKGIDSNEDIEAEKQGRLMRGKSLRSEILTCVENLRSAQVQAAESIRGKMQHALCLLQNFSLII